jgi:hypothetical protein
MQYSMQQSAKFLCAQRNFTRRLTPSQPFAFWTSRMGPLISGFNKAGAWGDRTKSSGTAAIWLQRNIWSSEPTFARMIAAPA